MTAVPAFRRRLVRATLVVGALVMAATAGLVLSPGADRTIAAVGDPLGAGGEYHQLNPVRIHDSRRSEGGLGPSGLRSSGPTTSVAYDVSLFGGRSPLQFTDGNGDGFDDNVLAVVANVTVITPTRHGHLTIFPKGSSPGESSVTNFQPGQVVANSTILRPGAGGNVSLHLNTPSGAGNAHVVVDISGWFSTSGYHTRGARVVAVEPNRLYDSKDTGSTLRGAQQIAVQIRGAKGGLVPDSGNVVGAIVNLTGVNAFGGSTQTHMAVVPDPFGGVPGTSTLNLSPGQTRANLAIVPVSSDGKIRLFNLQGEVRMVVDITGYLLAGQDVNTRAGRVIPLETSFRSLDTRQDAFYDQPLGPAMAEDFSFQAFVGDVKIGQDPVGAQSALFGNLTAAGLEKQYSWGPPERSHMTVYPSPPQGASQTPPNISNLNVGQGEAVPNMALLRYGSDQRIRFFNFAGYVDYIFDVYAVVLAD
jgi:hypothetical protein